MHPKLIKTEADHVAALARLEAIFDAKPGTREGDEAELLVHLIKTYETDAFPIDLPSPVEAIRFRMEQQGLKQKDLVPYIGNASKVSEVLSGKLPLSITMIRALVKGLDIPAGVLLQEPGGKLPSTEVLEAAKHFPLAEMLKRGWFPGFKGTLAGAKKELEDLIRNFVGDLGPQALAPALNRQQVRNGGKCSEHALAAWRIRIASCAMRESLPSYAPGQVTEAFLKGLVQLSYLDQGPLLAKEYLNKSGIHLICERHLPKTHLDGAVMKLPNGSPVIGLTLRYDRIDNFWFTLLHELAHLALHLDTGKQDLFFDDMLAPHKSKLEHEADDFATKALIPEADWKKAKLTIRSSSAEVVQFAEKLKISPAIPAGKLRHEADSYHAFKGLLGSGKLRPMFGISV